jgi:hypothetical protein
MDEVMCVIDSLNSRVKAEQGDSMNIEQLASKHYKKYIMVSRLIRLIK